MLARLKKWVIIFFPSWNLQWRNNQHSRYGLKAFAPLVAVRTEGIENAESEEHLRDLRVGFVDFEQIEHNVLCIKDENARPDCYLSKSIHNSH